MNNKNLKPCLLFTNISKKIDDTFFKHFNMGDQLVGKS
jgi:hypothetical protein